MSVSNELFELCKQVYEATGWDDTKNVWSLQHTGSVEEQIIKEEIGDFEHSREPTECLRMGQPVLAPYYTSDYLLEKLPKKIKRDSSTGWLVLSPMDSQGAWSVGYEPDHTEHIDDYPMEWGESPVAALLKLTLKLHEEKML